MNEVEALRRVSEALLHLIERENAESGFSFNATDVSSRSGIGNIRVVKALIKELGIQLVDEDEVLWGEEDMERLERIVRLRPASGPSTNNSVMNYGSNNQIAVGGDVSGALSVTVTYEQVLEQLARDVERAPIAPEKRAAISTLAKGLAKEVGGQALKVSLGELFKAGYAHSDVALEALSQLGKLL